MADSRLHTDVSASIIDGSEEMFEFFCQPCSSKQHVEAVGYCEDCSEYLCVTCIDYHGQFTALRNHTLLDKSAMSKSNTSPKIQNNDAITEKCLKHPGKVLEYFCKTDSEICCSVCLTLNHSSCSGKSYVPDVSDDITKGQEYKILTADLDRLARAITKQQDKIDNASKCNEKYYSKALADIQAFRKHINERLDKMEGDAKIKLSKLHQENSDAVRSASAKCQSLLSDVKTMAEDLKKRAKAGKKNQLFVKVKLSFNRIADIERQTNENGECTVVGYAFEQSEKVQQIMSTLSAIWSLSIRQDDTPTKARYVREVNVKSEEDTKDCYISGIAVQTKDRIAVTDYNTEAVKLIDLQENKVISRLSVSSKPFDVIQIKPNQVAVALGNEEKIEILAVSDVLSKSHTISTPGSLIVGLAYNGSKLIAACQKPGSVKIIDMTGRILNNFNTNNNSEQLFIMPRHIALSCDKSIAYVTDIKANAVICMTPSGHVVSIYRHAKLQCPIGVDVGKHGVVYVCSKTDHTIHQLIPTGDHTRIILGHGQGLPHLPFSIAYGFEDDSLYISSSLKSGHGKCNYVRQYQLE